MGNQQDWSIFHHVFGADMVTLGHQSIVPSTPYRNLKFTCVAILQIAEEKTHKHSENKQTPHRTLGDNKMSTTLSVDDGPPEHSGDRWASSCCNTVMSLLGKVISYTHTHLITESTYNRPFCAFQGHTVLSPNLKSPISVLLFESLR